MEVGGQRHALAPLAKGKLDTHSIGGWVVPRAGLDGCEKNSSPPAFDFQIFQPVASRYTFLYKIFL